MEKIEAVNTKKTRFVMLDIMKGFGIVFVVICHTHCPLENYLTIFIISMFMMISGFCWSEKHTQTWGGVWSMIKKRFKDLMIPYFMYSIIFLSLTNIFIALHIYPAVQFGFPEYIGGVVSLICGLQGSLFTVTLWYFYQLFLVYVIHAIICRLFCNLMSTEHKRFVFYIVLTVASIVMLQIFQAHRELVIMKLFIRLVCCYVAFVMGVLVRILYNKLNISSITPLHAVLFVAAGLLLYYMNGFTTIDVAAGNITSVWQYVVAGIIGFIFIFCLSVILDNKFTKKIADVMSYLGQNTKPIMAMQYLFYKPVTLVYILICGLSITELERFPLIEDENLVFMWIFYTISGVVFSLLADKFLTVLKESILKKR